MYHFKKTKEAYEKTRQFIKEGKGDIRALKFPPYITFELVNACNFRCKMCPTSYMERKKREINFNVFKKAIDEISKHGSLIRFIGFEEPLLYSKIKDAIRYVKKKGLLLHITTNGSLLNKEIAKVIIDNKVDSIIFSFQGLTEKEYRFMRNVSPDLYSKIIKNIIYLSKKRNSKKPYLKITTTITERDSPKDREKFIKKHLNYVDEVQITGFTHLAHIAENFNKKNIWKDLGINKTEKIKGIKCFSPNYEMLIRGDGSVYGCCGIYSDVDNLKMGNIGKQKLFKIWHSKKADFIRKELGKGNLDKFKDCATCEMRYRYKNINSPVINAKKGEVEKFIKRKKHDKV